MEKGESQEQRLGFLSGVSRFKDITQGYNAGGTFSWPTFCEENKRRTSEFQKMFAIILNVIIPPFPQCMPFTSMDRTITLNVHLQ